MRTEKDIEAYLLRLNRRFEPAPEASVEGGPPSGATTFLLYSGQGTPIAVRVDPPLVVLRVHIGDVDTLAKDAEPALFRKLLELNVKSLVHAAYGLDGKRILLCAAHELENLDFNELEATIDEVELALAQQVPVLAELSSRREGDSSSKKNV